MERIYPIIETKVCIGCGKVFERKKNYFGKQWVGIKYCSSRCFGKKVSILQFERFKDETVHPRWKGNKVGYWGVHDWITKHYGQPKKCEVCGLDDEKKKYHWANINGLYTRNIKHWKRMCVSCHRKYDYNGYNKRTKTDTTK